LSSASFFSCVVISSMDSRSLFASLPSTSASSTALAMLAPRATSQVGQRIIVVITPQLERAAQAVTAA
jgi:hypothetical protein